MEKPRSIKHIDIRKLSDSTVRMEMQAELTSRLNNINQTIDERNVEDTWNQIKASVVEVSKSKLKSNNTKHRMTDVILKLMDVL